MKPLPLEFTFGPEAISGDYEPAQDGGWTDPSWPESYRVTGIRIGETWIPAEQLDEVTRAELNHYMLAVIREEAWADYCDKVYDEQRDNDMLTSFEQRLRRAV